jgi:hypothetical protein
MPLIMKVILSGCPSSSRLGWESNFALLFHNYVRPAWGLNGRTTAEAAGIKVEGENRWLTLIQNASKFKGGISEV